MTHNLTKAFGHSTPSAASSPEPRSARRAAWRGLRSTCPHCGKGKLFRAYLKPVAHCSVCQEPWETVRADDGPAWLTILVVGHIIGPILVVLVTNPAVPLWVSAALVPLLGGALCVAILPAAKGLFMGVIWATGAPTS